MGSSEQETKTVDVSTPTSGELLGLKQLITKVDLGMLRKRIMVILVIFVASLGLSFIFVSSLYHALTMWLHGQHLVIISPSEAIGVYITIASGTATAITLPFILWQFWWYVRKRVTKHEQKIIMRFFPVTLVAFLAGVCFGYFVVFRFIYHFLVKLAHVNFNILITAGHYFGFMTNIVIPFGFLFEMPIVVMLLTLLGVFKPVFLSRNRKYAYLILVIIASLLSPPEFLSHLSVAVPLILLYEISVVASRVVYRRRLDQNANHS